jgi:subtilisin family serine protease
MKKQALVFGALMLSFLFACQKEAKNDNAPILKPAKTWTLAAINQFVVESVRQNNQVFDWVTASDDLLFATLQQTDHMLAVGFKTENASADDALHQNAANDNDWKAAKATLVKQIVAFEQKINPSVDYSKLEMGTDFDPLNAFYIKIYGFETIQMLRQSPLVRYIYPTGFEPIDNQLVENRSSSGCDGYNGETLSNVNYTQVAPNAKASWTYDRPQITQAWSRSTGAGIGVMVVDAGLSAAQPLLQPISFKNGASNPNRTVASLSTYPSSINFWGTRILAYDPNPYSSCGHGTAMAGIIASPRNNLGASVGIAYNCNLISVRAVEDVLISNSYEELGVAAALNLAATRADVKIVSISLGSIISRSVIGDAIKAIRNAGKLPFCAAGTSYSWSSWWFGVVYPACMNEAIAVTGVDNNENTCSDCHDGSEVDYVAVMDRASDDKSVVTLATSGYQPTTVGGSSAATATTAGIAALIWSKNPTQTATQILNRMTASSSNYPVKNGSRGWGIVNANEANQF